MATVSHPPSEISLVRLLAQRHSVALCLAILIAMALVAALAPLIAPYAPNKMAIVSRLQHPGSNHWLGTDEYGRDILSRVIFAGRVSLIVGLSVSAFSSIFGVCFGVLGGFFRRLDTPVSRVVDAMMAFPDILLAIALVAALGGSVINVIIALSIVYTPRVARVARASTLVVRELAYVEAARALGTSTLRILLNHVLRSIVSPLVVQATFTFAYAMLAEAGLSFLGVGVDPSTPTWGTMINAGSKYVSTAGWMIFYPGMAITLCVLSLQIVGDGLRDALDPNLSKEL